MPYMSWVYGQAVSKMGPAIAMGSMKVQGSKVKQVNGSEPPRAIGVRDEATQRVATSWHIRRPTDGTRRPQNLYLSLDREISIMPLCGPASNHPGFLHGLPDEVA
jgi:hypothetical protein